MIIAQIVAVSENGVIGHNNQLLWHLPADLKNFREKTMGHYMLMGRKTFESIGRPLPGRTTVVLTKNRAWKAEGCLVVDSIENGIELAVKAGETELFVVGGGEVYRQTMPVTDVIYLTKIDTEVRGDVSYTFPDKKIWEEVSRSTFAADEKNPFSYSLAEWRKRK